MEPDLDSISAACGVIVDEEAAGGFEHVASAWQIAPGEWISAWPEELDERAGDLRLLAVHSGQAVAIAELERQGAVVGLRAEVAASVLSAEDHGSELRKRMPLHALGYPSVIDHPAFRLHRGSLSAERYLPYLCPWRVRGHCALFTIEQGWVTGATYPGMQGGPVFTDTGAVVGVLLPGETNGRPPLSAFARIG